MARVMNPDFFQLNSIEIVINHFHREKMRKHPFDSINRNDDNDAKKKNRNPNIIFFDSNRPKFLLIDTMNDGQIHRILFPVVLIFRIR